MPIQIVKISDTEFKTVEDKTVETPFVVGDLNIQRNQLLLTITQVQTQFKRQVEALNKQLTDLDAVIAQAKSAGVIFDAVAQDVKV